MARLWRRPRAPVCSLRSSRVSAGWLELALLRASEVLHLYCVQMAPSSLPPTWLLGSVRGLRRFPGHQASACKKPRGSVPVPLLAKPGLSLLVVVSVATQSRFPEPLGLAAALFFIEEVVEGVACFS